MLENPWGYRKRFTFVRNSIQQYFPGVPDSSVKVLDIGCGNGSMLALPLAGCGYDVTGVDPDAKSIEVARRTAPPNADFKSCYLSELPNSPFEVVILSEVLEHLHRPEDLLNQAAGYLGTNGIMIVTVPNGYGEYEIDHYVFYKFRLNEVADRFRRKRVSVASSEDHAGHVQWFRMSRLRSLFSSHGLRMVDKGGSTLACGPLASYLFNFLPAATLDLNAKVTDYLPMAAASGWYFVLQRESAGSSAASRVQ